MSLIPRFTTFAFSVAALAPSALGQVIIVDPNGGGQYRDLQTAINAAPDGAKIEVRGGTYREITITNKSLRIFGNPAPRISAPNQGRGTQPSAITIRGTGQQQIVLASLNIGGARSTDLDWMVYLPTVDIDRVRDVSLLDCTVRATSVLTTSRLQGALGLRARNTQLVRVHGGSIQAATSVPVRNSDPRQMPNGSAGIDAGQAVVEATGATIRGGSVAPYTGFGPITGRPCPCPGYGGTGGDAVIASLLDNTGSTLVPGVGSRITHINPTGPGTAAWGQMPSGKPFVGLREYQWTKSVLSAPTFRLGTTWTATISPGTGRAMLYGSPATQPVVLGPWTVFLDLNRPLSGQLIADSATQWSYPVPNNTVLLGGRFMFQLIQSTGSYGPHLEIARR